MAHAPRHCQFLLIGAMIAAGASGCSQFTPSPRPQPAAPARPAGGAFASRPTLTQVRAELTAVRDGSLKDPATLVEIALLDLRAGDLASAERELRDCCERFPRYARGFFQLGMLYLQHGKEFAAVSPLKIAAKLSRDDAAVPQSAALACFRTGRIEEAKLYARMALKIAPRFADTYLLLARMYDALGTSEQALQYVRNYLRYSPNPAPGYYLMGQIYARQASREKAEQWLRHAVDAEPSNAEFWVALGRVCYELYYSTKAQEGMRYYERALELDPNNSSAHRYLGHALLDQRRYAEAVTHLQAALAGADDPGPILYDLGQALVKSGRSEEGKRTLVVYRQQQQYARGAQKLMDAVSAAPGDRRRQQDLARYCLGRGRYSAALAAIEAYQARFGDDAAVRPLYEQAKRGVQGSPSQQGNAAGEILPRNEEPGVGAYFPHSR